MRDLVTALGLVLVIEGLLYAANPSALKRMMSMVQDMPEQTMRTCGFVAFGLGFVVVWLARTGL